jgi:hypothetical protein
MTRARASLAAALVLGACGGSTAGNVDLVDASVDRGGNHCENVGCASAPPCEICTAPCGCCGCPTGARCACQEDGSRDAESDSIGDAPIGVWRELTIFNGYGPCPPGSSCTSTWSVTPAGHVASTRLGEAGAGDMTPADLSELDSILSSASFVDAMTNGFVCNPPPTDIFVSFRLDFGSVSLRQDVTGCLFPPGIANAPHRVNDLVTKY